MMRCPETLRRAIAHLLPLLALAACGSGPAASTPAAPATPAVTADQAVRLFDYDAKAPLDLQVVSTETRNGLTYQQITYASPKGGRVPGLLIVPAGPGPFAGMLLMHGLPGTYERMRPDAEALARRGAVALAINAPFSRPGAPEGGPVWFDSRDRDNQIQLIVDLRRGVDLLLARPDVDKDRLGYVGISYGGAQGGLLAGVETRIKAYVLVVGDGGLVSHFTGADDKDAGPLQNEMPPEQAKRWLAAMEPIEPLRFVGRAAPAQLLFQNGRHDQLVPPADGRTYQEAGSEPKTVLWYDEGHGLNDQALRDRHDWLAARLKLAPSPP